MMNKKELNEIVALKNIEDIETALINRGWQKAEPHPIAGGLNLVDLFKSTELLASKYAKDKENGYEITIYDGVNGGKKWLWAVLYVDKRIKMGWRPKEIRIYIQEKNN